MTMDAINKALPAGWQWEDEWYVVKPPITPFIVECRGHCVIPSCIYVVVCQASGYTAAVGS